MRLIEAETVDTAPVVHGRWIDCSYALDPDVIAECSNCAMLTARKSDYCPDCGAKMDGKEPE